ncbi:MAG: S8 family serine peptidase [Promethearchaeota archaeon]
MKKRVLIFSALLFMIFTLPTLASGAVRIEHIGTEYQGYPFNFQDFPEDFSTGILPWDLDIIDRELVEETGEGVYVAVLDTGLVSNWNWYFPEERIKTEWGRGFVDKGVLREDKTGVFVSKVVESADFIGIHPHGTHVTSTIIGYSIRGTNVRGVAPEATIIPVKVLEYYPNLEDDDGIKGVTFGTSEAVAAGIDYVTDLAIAHSESRFIISMSLGAAGEEITEVEQAAIDRAIANNVIVVASAGNEGSAGMGSPGSYGPVISVGSSGWAWTDYWWCGEWVFFDGTNLWISGNFWTTDVPEDNVYLSYISDFSSRERDDLGWDQELDLVAPGSWVVGPYPDQGALPWWSEGASRYHDNGAWDYYFVGGTSMACPHVSGVAALMLEVNPGLVQHEVEALLMSSADPLPFSGTKDVVDPNLGVISVSWGYDGYDAVGAGLLQADSAVLAAAP